MTGENSNVKSFNINIKDLLDSIKKLGWKVEKTIPPLIDWKIIEDHFDFHSVPGNALKKIIDASGGDPIIINLNPDAWLGDWKIAILKTSEDYGMVLIDDDAPRAYYKESGIVLSSLKDDIQTSIDSLINTDTDE